jgi:hypothetical protein
MDLWSFQWADYLVPAVGLQKSFLVLQSVGELLMQHV